jgi:hypothetical protein
LISTDDNAPISWAALEFLAKSMGQDALARQIKRTTVSEYDQFIDILYADIDAIVHELQLNPELRKDDDEDRLSIEIKGNLTHLGYGAAHESKIGGHTDLSVQYKGFIWIGEAKINRDYEHIFQGFQQLTTRYATGDEGQCKGGLVIYIKSNNSKQVMDRWRANLNKRGITDLEFVESSIRPDHIFFTRHTHERSGRPFTTRHVGVILGFDPKDHK